MGDFDSIKIGVCDAYWTPAGGNPATDEIFLGLTKGGCELTYTPEWYDLQVDRYGRSQTDAALVGESISVKIPLAETDMRKIEMFAHTATKALGDGNKSKLTFGRFPGFRLGQKAGRLRLHPVAMGKSKTEDVIIYKAVNKAPLQLNYKLDEERIFSTEFIGMIQRKHINGAMLWEIGDSTMGTEGLQLASTLDVNGLPTNLLTMVKQSGGTIWISTPQHPVYTELSDVNLRTAVLKAYCEFNGEVYDITSLTTFTLPNKDGAWINNRQIVGNARLPSQAPNLAIEGVGADAFASIAGNVFTAKTWEGYIASAGYYKIKGDPAVTDSSIPSNWAPLALGDNVWVVVRASAGGMTAEASVIVQMA